MTTNDRPHWSPTQLEMLSRCGEAYRRRYIEQEILPPGVAQTRGLAVHGAARNNFSQKVDSRADLPRADIVESAVAAFEAETAAGLYLTDDEAARGLGVVVGEAKDAVSRLAGVLADEVSPDYQPTLVEQSIRLELPGERDLLCVVDLVDDRRRVVDFKTSHANRQQADADQSLQLTAYAAAHQALTGQPAAGVRLDVLVDGSTPGRQVLDSQRGDHDIDVLAARINRANAIVQAGAFSPALPGAWWCSQRFCGYAATCPFFAGARADAARARKPGRSKPKIVAPAAPGKPNAGPTIAERRRAAWLAADRRCQDCQHAIDFSAARLTVDGRLICAACRVASWKVGTNLTPVV